VVREELVDRVHVHASRIVVELEAAGQIAAH
jgi:hypothetical protein